MPDTTPTPDPSTAPAKPKFHRSSSNQLHLNELKDVGKVAKSALDPRYNPVLLEVEMDPALPGQINTLATTIKLDLGKIKGARTGRKAMTKQEKNARTALLAALAPIQSAAKRRFEGEEETLRANYGIGEALGSQSLETVTTTCIGILARLGPGANNAAPIDILPGIKPDKQIDALADAIELYGAKNIAQGDEQSTASAILEKVGSDIAILASLRRKIQLAADQSWPWRTKGVATIRAAFLLPKDRPMTE